MTKVKYDENLKIVLKKLKEMSDTVELAIKNSIKALIERDLKLSAEIISNDEHINYMQNHIEDLCLKILLLEHPFAKDFRNISAILKLVTDLERVGDYAVNISGESIQIGNDKIIPEASILKEMSEYAIKMLNDGIKSYIEKDITLASGLEKRDDKIDAMLNESKSIFVKVIKKENNKQDQAISLLMIAQFLERVADHAVNIGEWTIYAVKGDVKK